LRAPPFAKRLKDFRRDQPIVQPQQEGGEMTRHAMILRKGEELRAVGRMDKFTDADKIGAPRRTLEEQRPLAIGRTRFEGRQDFSVTIQTVVYVNGKFISRWES
jgi:hypothetical protein